MTTQKLKKLLKHYKENKSFIKSYPAPEQIKANITPLKSIEKTSEYADSFITVNDIVKKDTQFERAVRHGNVDKAKKRSKVIIKGLIDTESDKYLRNLARHNKGEVQTGEEFRKERKEDTLAGSLLGTAIGGLAGVSAGRPGTGMLAGGVLGGLGAFSLSSSGGPTKVRKPSKRRIEDYKGIISQLDDTNSQVYKELIGEKIDSKFFRNV